MALSIQTNIASLQAQMNLNKASQSLAKNQERLSTGLRINSAADDAAGLAISDRMTAQIRGLNQASMNANDGISLAKTAEGALDETTNILQRMRELAVQSANDSNTADDRASIQAEVDQLISEVDRIAANTNYNTKTLLDGTLTSNVFQVGSNSNETIEFGINGAKASDLGTFGGVSGGEFQVATTTSNVKSDFADVAAGNSLSALEAGALTINGTEIDASKSGDDTASSTDNAASATAVAEAINAQADTTGVTAKAEKAEASFDVTQTSSSLNAGDISINGIDIGAVTLGQGSDDADAQALADAINEKSDESGVTASNDSGEITLTAVDGRNIEISASGGTAADLLDDFADGDTKVVRGQVSLYSSESFEISGDDPNSIGLSPGGVELSSSLSDIADLSATAVTSNPEDDIGNLTLDNTLDTLSSGDLTINGVDIGATSAADDTLSTAQNSGSAIAIAAAINSHVEETQVSATVGETTAIFDVSNTDAALNSGNIEINGISVGAVAATSSLEDQSAELVSQINAITDQTGVEANTTTNGTVTLTATDGRNIEMSASGATAENLLDDFSDGETAVVRGQVTLESYNGDFEIGGNNPDYANLTAGTQSGGDGTDSFSDLAQGDLVVNGYSVDAASNDGVSYVDGASSALAIQNAINNTDGLSSEVEATAYNEANLGKVTANNGDGGILSINGVEVDLSSTQIEDGDSSGALSAAINQADAGVVASVNDDGELLLTAEDGRNIDVAITAAANTADTNYLGGVNTTDTFHVASKGTVSLEAKEGSSIESVEGDRKALAGIANQNGLISNLDVTTKTGAQNAIDSIDAAISQVDQTKANLGAIQNRFDSTISNLNNVQQNITDARSRIMDADIAKEAAEMTQNNVRQQAAAAVLTQANQNPQLALQLLG